MTYTFRWRSAPLVDVIEGEYTVKATSLYDAVSQFKRYLVDVRGETPLVVSYFYLVESSEKTFLGEFTERFYKKHFGGL